MDNLRLVLAHDVTPAEIGFLDERINEHNVARTGVGDGKYLAVWLRDEAEQIVGGLFGWTWAGWLEIRFLWIREDARGQGYGQKMLLLAEKGVILTFGDGESVNPAELLAKRAKWPAWSFRSSPACNSRAFSLSLLVCGCATSWWTPPQ